VEKSRKIQNTKANSGFNLDVLAFAIGSRLNFWRSEIKLYGH
jgi:hypothetical protein